jgi:hypothetical protein
MQLMMLLMLQWAAELLHQLQTTQMVHLRPYSNTRQPPRVSVDLQSIFRLIKAYLHFPFTGNSGAKGWFTEEHKDKKETNC